MLAATFRLGFFVLIVATAACRPAYDRDLTFHIENGDSVRLDSVVVFTTGHQYIVGSLAPGERRSVVVTTNGESRFEIEHGHAERKRINVGGYFERGYRGSFFARVSRDSVLTVADSTRS